MFSSGSSGFGNPGQTNYGMSNSIMERICEARQLEDLPGIAIEWGAIGDVGYLEDKTKNNEKVVVAGTSLQKIDSCLDILDDLLTQKNCPIVCSMVIPEKSAFKKKSNTNIVDAVLNMLGYKDLKNVSLNTPLPELGMDSMMSVEIKQILERQFSVFLTPKDISNMTFEKLQDIEKTVHREKNVKTKPKSKNV